MKKQSLILLFCCAIAALLLSSGADGLQIGLGTAFSYDPSRDEMFRRYARLYQRQGQTAMEDTLGQAAGLTGGYDSSYAQQAGQQEYNRYMQ